MEQPVETLEGWYCEHLVWNVNWQAVRRVDQTTRKTITDSYQRINDFWTKWSQHRGVTIGSGSTVLKETWG